MTIYTITGKITLVVFAITLLLIEGCSPGAESDSQTVLASVGSETLTLDDALEQIPAVALRDDTLQAIESFKEQWIYSRVTVNEARRLQLHLDRSFRERVERLEQQLLEDMLVEYVLAENSDELAVSVDEARNYFQVHRDKFVLDEKYLRFRHLTTNTRTEIDNARRDLMNGISWQDVVSTYSLNPELQLRESKQFWPYSMAVGDIPVLNRYLGVIGISEISPIHYHNGRYHFVQLMEERAEGDPPGFDWLIPQIREWLKLEKSQRITNTYKRNLYLQAESNNDIQRLSKENTESALKNYTGTTESN